VVRYSTCTYKSAYAGSGWGWSQIGDRSVVSSSVIDPWLNHRLRAGGVGLFPRFDAIKASTYLVFNKFSLIEQKQRFAQLNRWCKRRLIKKQINTKNTHKKPVQLLQRSYKKRSSPCMGIIGQIVSSFRLCPGIFHIIDTIPGGIMYTIYTFYKEVYQRTRIAY
jgi:hypothetical protein